MSDRRRTTLTWLLRIVGVGLLVWVLATQVQWEDRVALRDGPAHVGTVESVTDEAVTMRKRDGAAPVVLPIGDLATRAYGDQQVPDVRYGARTLARRLGRSLPTVLLVLLALSVLVVLTAWRWMLLMRAVGLVVAFPRCVRLTFIGGFFNLAVPGATGGDVVKAWYAAKETGAGTRAVLSVFVDRFVGLLGLVVFAAGALVVAGHGDAYAVPRTVVWAVLGCGLLAGLVVVVRPVRRALGLSFLVRRLPFQGVIEELRASARLYKGHLGTLLVALAISLFNHATNATACYLLAQALGIEGVTLAAAMSLVPLANLLSAIPLLPGGWGVGELAFAYFFGLVGVPATEAVGLSVVFRFMVLGVNLPGGVLWIFWKDHPSTERIQAEVEEAAAHVAEAEGA